VRPFSSPPRPRPPWGVNPKCQINVRKICGLATWLCRRKQFCVIFGKTREALPDFDLFFLNDTTKITQHSETQRLLRSAGSAGPAVPLGLFLTPETLLPAPRQAEFEFLNTFKSNPSCVFRLRNPNENAYGPSPTSQGKRSRPSCNGKGKFVRRFGENRARNLKANDCHQGSVYSGIRACCLQGGAGGAQRGALPAPWLSVGVGGGKIDYSPHGLHFPLMITARRIQCAWDKVELDQPGFRTRCHGCGCGEPETRRFCSFVNPNNPTGKPWWSRTSSSTFLPIDNRKKPMVVFR